MIETGYYGVPGKIGGKVHLAEGHKPMCGTHLHPKAEFQWCARGVVLSYVECQRCHLIGELIEQEAELRRMVDMARSERRRYRERLEVAALRPDLSVSQRRFVATALSALA